MLCSLWYIIFTYLVSRLQWGSRRFCGCSEFSFPNFPGWVVIALLGLCFLVGQQEFVV